MSDGATTLGAGIHTGIPAAAYHADPCAPFSLSRGLAHRLLTSNPKKAAHAHPKLGKGTQPKANRAMDSGSAVHGIMLDAGPEIQVLSTIYNEKHKKAGQPVTDYATKAAEEERDAIRRAGNIPALVHQEATWRNCAAEGLRQLREHPDGRGFFEPGHSEAVVIWQEDDLWFRIMVDRLPNDPRASPYDLKLTEMSAAPGSWDRRLQSIYAFQDAFYRRGLKAVRGIMPAPMLFPVLELEEPFCLATHAPAPSLQDIASRQVERAIRIWRECVRTNAWPGYPPFTAWVEAPNWLINQAEEQDLRDEIAMEQAA